MLQGSTTREWKVSVSAAGSYLHEHTHTAQTARRRVLPCIYTSPQRTNIALSKSSFQCKTLVVLSSFFTTEWSGSCNSKCPSVWKWKSSLSPGQTVWQAGLMTLRVVNTHIINTPCSMFIMQGFIKPITHRAGAEASQTWIMCRPGPLSDHDTVRLCSVIKASLETRVFTCQVSR